VKEPFFIFQAPKHQRSNCQFQKTSRHSWGHVNMVGEYYFVEKEGYQKFDAA
jgi:hypothetical protein